MVQHLLLTLCPSVTPNKTNLFGVQLHCYIYYIQNPTLS